MGNPTLVTVEDVVPPKSEEGEKGGPKEKAPAEKNEGRPVPESEAELQAMQHGWRPQTEWEGDPEEWVNAREFNFRGELMGKISQMGKKLGAYEKNIELLQKTVRGFTESQKELAEKAYKRAMRDLRKERIAAEADGDLDAVLDIDEQVDELKERREQMKAEPTQERDVYDESGGLDITKLNPYERAFIDYVNTDPRFADNDAMIQQLGQYADQILASGQPGTMVQYLNKLDAYTNRLTSARRGQLPQPEPSGDSGGGRKYKAQSKYTINDCSEMEKSFAKTFVETGAHNSIQEAVDSMAAANALEIQQ